MTKSAIRGVPRELPHARLYLDDLIEIEGILSAAFAKLSPSQTVSFVYELDAAQRMTTHEDLIDHGGHSKNFNVRVASEDGKRISHGALWFYSSLSPRFDVPYELDDQRWAIYGEIERIFAARADKLKNFALSFPRPVLFGLFGALSALFIIGLPNLIVLIIKHKVTFAYIPWLVPLVLFYAIIAFLVYASGREDRIYFRYKREEQKARDAVWRDRGEKLAWLIIGLIAGVIGTLVTNHLTH